jgi:hypothetical protein
MKLGTTPPLIAAKRKSHGRAYDHKTKHCLELPELL